MWQQGHMVASQNMGVGPGLTPRYYLLVGDLSASAEALLWQWESEHGQETPLVQTFQAHGCKAPLV